MKTAISLPDDAFRRFDERAARLRMNRSEFFVAAAEHYLRSLDDADVTAAIDAALVATPESTTDSVREASLARLLAVTGDDEW